MYGCKLRQPGGGGGAVHFCPFSRICPNKGFESDAPNPRVQFRAELLCYVEFSCAADHIRFGGRGGCNGEWIYLRQTGSANISVVSPSGAAATPVAFQVTAPLPTAPQITAVTPQSLQTLVATTISITGKNFTNSSVVRFNAQALATTYRSAQQLDALVPSSLLSAPGQADISVLDTNDQLSIPFTVSIVQTGNTISVLAGPSPVQFHFVQGATLPDDHLIYVIASTNGVAYSVTTSGEPWLSVAPASGTSPGSIDVTVNPSALAAGVYHAVITVRSQRDAARSNRRRNHHH